MSTIRSNLNSTQISNFNKVHYILSVLIRKQVTPIMSATNQPNIRNKTTPSSPVLVGNHYHLYKARNNKEPQNHPNQEYCLRHRKQHHQLINLKNIGNNSNKSLPENIKLLQMYKLITNVNTKIHDSYNLQHNTPVNQHYKYPITTNSESMHNYLYVTTSRLLPKQAIIRNIISSYPKCMVDAASKHQQTMHVSTKKSRQSVTQQYTSTNILPTMKLVHSETIKLNTCKPNTNSYPQYIQKTSTNHQTYSQRRTKAPCKLNTHEVVLHHHSTSVSKLTHRNKSTITTIQSATQNANIKPTNTKYSTCKFHTRITAHKITYNNQTAANQNRPLNQIIMKSIQHPPQASRSIKYHEINHK
eukprot:gene3431-2382_t